MTKQEVNSPIICLLHSKNSVNAEPKDANFSMLSFNMNGVF